jgi:hypothetical protein
MCADSTPLNPPEVKGELALATNELRLDEWLRRRRVEAERDDDCPITERNSVAEAAPQKTNVNDWPANANDEVSS